MIKEFKIPDMYYKYGVPQRTDYNENDNYGLLYKEGGEMAFELAAAFGGSASNQYSVVSFLSPYILGFENMGKGKKVIDVDIEKRIVIVELEDK